MTDRTQRTYDAYAGANPELGWAVGVLASAVYTQFTKMQLPYTDISRVFINDAFFQRKLKENPCGQKFAELTGLDKFGITRKENLTDAEFEEHGDAMMDMQDAVNNTEFDEEAEADDLAQAAEWATIGITKAVKQDFMTYLMTENIKVDDRGLGTPLELLASSINDVVAYSMAAGPFDPLKDAEELFQAEIGITGLFAEMGLAQPRPPSPQHQFENLVNDVGDIMVRQVMARLDELHKAHLAPPSPGSALR